MTGAWEGLVGSTAIVVAAAVLANGWLNFGVWDPGALNAIGLNNAIAAMALALIALSLVPLTGWAGQVNFAPLAFAGFGAWVYLEFSGGDGNLLWLPLVGLVCAPLGALVALPAARLQGLYLALMTIAFAQLMSTLFFAHDRVFASSGSGTQYESLHLLGYDFDTRYRLFLLVVTAVALTIFVLVLLRRSRYGRRWVALSDSPAASATVGVSVIWTKVIVYAFSASLAGMAGVFWATSKGAMDVRDFDLLKGLELVLLMAAAGMSIPAAGLFLSFRFVFAALAERLDDTGSVPWLVWTFDEILVPFGPGLLAIGMVVNQRGAIYEMGRGFAPLLPWRADAREEQARERAGKREPEVGELGLTRPFTADDVAGLDRELGITSDV
jgi:branched-chain amino acid transport system permease protein